MKTKKIVLYVGVAFLITSTALLGYHFYTKNKENKGSNNKNDGKNDNVNNNLNDYDKLDNTETTTSQKETATDNSNIIKLGSGGNVTKGKYVAQLQDLLNYLDNAKLVVDGRFGANTIKAWRKHQGLFYSLDTDFTKVELSKLLSEAMKKGYKFSNELKKTMAKYQY